MSLLQLHSLESTLVGIASTTLRRASGAPEDSSRSARYRLERLLGWGGMGLVYEATQLTLGLPVALKMLRPEFGDCDERVTAFLDEAHWLATLSSEYIVRVLDAGRFDTGLPFFVMERLEGRDLRSVVTAAPTPS